MASYRHICGHYENRINENYIEPREAVAAWSFLLCTTCYNSRLADKNNVAIIEHSPTVLTHFGGHDLDTTFK